MLPPSAVRCAPADQSLSASAPLDNHCARQCTPPSSNRATVAAGVPVPLYISSRPAAQRHRRPRDTATPAIHNQSMEAPLHQYYPVPPLPPAAQGASSLLHQAVAARALMMAAAGAAGTNKHALSPPSSEATSPGREQCPRCASRDTKFCYYNNYNTAQPRHFCRACRRYWTLGGSLRNVPVGGSTRKRPRHARRPTRAMYGTASAVSAATTAASAGGGPFAAPATLHGGLLLSSLLLAGSVSASASASAASPLLALGSAPLLEGRLGCFDIGLGDDAAAAEGAAAADMAHHQQQLPLPWPAATTATIFEGDRAETTMKDASSSVFPFPPAAALWQELAVAAPALHHGSAAPHLLL